MGVVLSETQEGDEIQIQQRCIDRPPAIFIFPTMLYSKENFLHFWHEKIESTRVSDFLKTA